MSPSTTQKTFFKNIYQLAIFALPLSASMLIQMLTSFIAMFMVAKLGEKELAAGALAVTTNITVNMVSLVFYAVGILISHSRGQQNSLLNIGEIVKNGMWLALLLFLPASLLLWYANYILLLFHQDRELIALCVTYFHFAALAMLPSLICMVIFQFFTGLGRPRVSMILSTAMMPVTLLFSYSFILGKFGFPQLGLAGIPSALLVSQIFVCLGLLSFLFFSTDMKKYGIFSGKLTPDFVLIKKLFALGYPIGLQFGGELSAMTLATYFMGYFGTTALAASQIVSQYTLLVVMIILGLSQAVTMLSSEAFGKQETESISQYVMSAIYVLSFIFIGIFIAFFFYSYDLIAFFGGPHAIENPLLVHLAEIFFIIAAIFLYADGIRNIVSGALRGLHDSKIPMNVGIICLWAISIPASYIIGITLHTGPIGLRLGFVSGIMIASVILSKRLKDKIISYKYA